MGSWTNPNIQQITTLITAGSVTGNPAGTVTAGSAFNVMNLVNVSQFASYDLNAYAYAQSPGSAGSVVTCQVQLQWFDDLSSGIPVFEEDWYIWAGRAAPVAGVNTLSACGPMHGQYMTVNVWIPSGAAANATLQYMNIYGSGRQVPDSDWRQNGQAVNPQIENLVIQGGGGLSFENILASATGLVLTANTVGFIPLGLYAGPVFVRYSKNVAAAAGAVIACAAAVTGGQLVAGAACPGIIWYDQANSVASTTEIETTILLPRSACLFIVKAPSGSSISISLEIIAQQAA